MGNWYALVSIVDEAMAYAAIEPKMRLLACPNDGEPYTQGPDGALFCTYDGYRPDGTYIGDFPRVRLRSRY